MARTRIAPDTAACDDRSEWELVRAPGPVMAVALHDAHAMRDALLPYLAIDSAERRREEDPLTGVFATMGHTQIRARKSRFECDLNRPPEGAVSVSPEQTWGLRVWNRPPPDEEVETSIAMHRRFYAMLEREVERIIELHGLALVLDIHSYNHRREGPGTVPADPALNPQLDLGLTETDRSGHADLLETLVSALGEGSVAGRPLDVRENVRYPDSGHFAEWLRARFGARACPVTLEYKKFYMDEWSGLADLGIVDDLRCGLGAAVRRVEDLQPWR